MKYRKDKYGNNLSVLGFGCMRFKKKMGRINMDDAERQVMKAYNNGVNYFDTAFIYPGSEAAIGEIFEKNNIRDKVYIATKFPPQRVYHRHRRISSHEVHISVGLMRYKTKILMICNFYEIDDIQILRI